jgi:hypothetical protein
MPVSPSDIRFTKRISRGVRAQGRPNVATGHGCVLLYGFIVASKAEAVMAVVGDFISYEPYASCYAATIL